MTGLEKIRTEQPELYHDYIATNNRIKELSRALDSVKKRSQKETIKKEIIQNINKQNVYLAEICHYLLAQKD